MIAAIQWAPDPDLLCLGTFCIKWYGACWVMAIISGYYHGINFFTHEKKDIGKVVSLVQHLFLGGFLGARLGEFLFYSPELLVSDPIQFFYFRNGGMSSHGGFLGVCIAIALFVRKNPEFTYLWILDRMAVAGASIVVLMRIGNLINSELSGTPTTLPWGFLFVLIEENPIPRHPVVLYEAIAYTILWGVYVWLYSKGFGKKNGLLSAVFLTTLVPSRIILECFKTSDQALWMHLSRTQWLSVPLVVAGLLWFIYILKTKDRALS